MLNQPVTVLKGVGPAKGALFEKMGVRSVRDLLYRMPREYQDFSTLTPAAAMEHGRLYAVRGTAMNPPAHLRPRGGLDMVTLSLLDEAGIRFQAVWFHQPYRKSQFAMGETYILCGRADRTRGLKLQNPTAVRELPGLLPVYPLVQGLSQNAVRAAVQEALKLAAGNLPETLTPELRARYQLCERNFALKNLHRPESLHNVALARRRLAFEDMLLYMLAVSMLRQERERRPGISFKTEGALNTLQEALPFSLTKGQKQIAGEIARDMASALPMNRLVQGDVGSGKTALALYAIQVAVDNGYQGVMMAPTEILARQHYGVMCRLFGEENCCLVIGGMKKKEREEAYSCIAEGRVKAITGTHALLQEGVTFFRLGLVVTDEQHRFGVRQRARIAGKGGELPPDVLIMSATPIPRTLALILYGDLDVSVLSELPPGRKPVITRMVPGEKREDMYGFIKSQAVLGRQTYVVCPLVEQTDGMEAKNVQDIHRELCGLMPEVSIGILHGRMAAKRKEETVAAFRAGEIQILVSTTVVEVGVDVPNATIMVVENAERFGLAQLHQLRGRVGRGDQRSYCFLLAGIPGAQERLTILTKTGDGFEIAQKDLELRGPGEFLGTRQHGLDELSGLCMAADLETLQSAKEAAWELLNLEDRRQYHDLFDRACGIYDQRMKEIAAN